MNKGVDMIKRSNMVLRYAFTLGLIFSLGLGQSNGYLAQKLMIENNLRKRISDALEKVIDKGFNLFRPFIQIPFFERNGILLPKLF